MKAIVIGAGIGGLAAAIGLRRAGLEVEVFERAAELGEVGAGLSLWVNAIRALEKLGVADAIRPFSLANVQAGLRSWKGDLINDGSVGPLRERFGDFCLVLHRADLQAALLAAAGRSIVRTGKPCVGVQQDATGATARFADGTTARGDLLVGADGLHSAVRAALHGQRRPTYAGYTTWRAVVPFPHDVLRPGETWGRGSRFGHLPMSGERVYWYAAHTAPEGQSASPDHKTELQRLFRTWHAPIEALIDATDEARILRNDVYDRPQLRSWGQGRVTLVGDAAHPMTPNLGQGACQALEDAVVLARGLEGAPDVAAALRAYEAQRIPRVNAIVTLSRRAGAIGQWTNPVAIALRNALIKSVGARFQTKQLAQIIGYEV